MRQLEGGARQKRKTVASPREEEDQRMVGKDQKNGNERRVDEGN